jgi:hypothetical protein
MNDVARILSAIERSELSSLASLLIVEKGLSLEGSGFLGLRRFLEGAQILAWWWVERLNGPMEVRSDNALTRTVAPRSPPESRIGIEGDEHNLFAS